MSVSIGNFITLYVQSGAAYIPFGGELSSSFSISKDAIEITTKDSVDEVGNFVKEFDGKGEYTYSFSVDGIQRPDTPVSTVITLLQGGEKIKFRFGSNGTPGGKVFEGDGYVLSVEMSAPKNEAVTFSAEIQGTGGLKEITLPLI